MRFLFILVILYGTVHSQHTPRIPPNPCPKVFNYYYDTDQSIFGEILVPNDGTRVFKLELNTSYIGIFDEKTRPKLKLDLVTQNDYILQAKQLTYKLTFTRQDIIPRITQIKFNGRVYCNGPPEDLTLAGVTSSWVYKEVRLQTFVNYQEQPTTTRPQPQPIGTTKPTLPPFIPPRPTTSFYPPEYWTNRPGGGVANPALMVDISQNDPQCGLSDRTQNLIVGGVSTVQNEFPWLAALYQWENLNYEFRCTATLIDQNHVVTAAHCLRFYNSDLINQDDILLILGQSRLKHWAENSNAVLRRVIKVEVNPDYKQYTGHGDIAVLTLNKRVEYSKTLKPICLWNDYDDIRYVEGKYGTVTGWGKDDRQQEYLVDSKKVDMPIVSQARCLSSNSQFQKLTSEKTFCAGDRNGRGPCTSDSGSPFMLQKNGRWTLRGIVSQAIVDKNSAKCNLEEYIVFADLAKYTRWIRSKLY